MSMPPRLLADHFCARLSDSEAALVNVSNTSQNTRHKCVSGLGVLVLALPLA